VALRRARRRERAKHRAFDAVARETIDLQVHVAGQRNFRRKWLEQTATTGRALDRLDVAHQLAIGRHAALAAVVPTASVIHRRICQTNQRVVALEIGRRIRIRNERQAFDVPGRAVPHGAHQRMHGERAGAALPRERYGIDLQLRSGPVDHVERGPEASGVLRLAVRPALSGAAATGGHDQHVAVTHHGAVEQARSGVVLVPMQDEHGAPQRVQRGQRRTGAERRHRELLAVGVGHQLGQGLLDTPAQPARRILLDFDQPQIGDRRGHQVMMQQKQHRIVARGARNLRGCRQQVFLAERAAGAQKAVRQVRGVVGDDPEVLAVQLAWQDRRQERRRAAVHPRAFAERVF